MNIKYLLEKALNMEFLNLEEGLSLFKHAATAELMHTAHELRKIHKKESNTVTWIIDRNVNITNVCYSNCKFCNFHVKPGSSDEYITSIEQYKTKIDELIMLDGDQLLLQGGLHPKLGLSFYTNLFSELKKLYPNVKLHALGPPEIVHLSKTDKISYEKVLRALMNAGLDSLPGAGAEILCDRVRTELSKAKCNTQEWLDVMMVAHQLGLTTSATMMFGHIETIAERFKHLIKIRNTQALKPISSKGFIAFIPWTFQDSGTYLQTKMGITNQVSNIEYIRMIALSRIMLPNIQNIQVSWLTVGIEIAQICLHAGANDTGSIMIEENVVSSAGASYSLNAQGMQKMILDAGFIPKRRNQQYEFVENN